MGRLLVFRPPGILSRLSFKGTPSEVLILMCFFSGRAGNTLSYLGGGGSVFRTECQQSEFSNSGSLFSFSKLFIYNVHMTEKTHEAGVALYRKYRPQKFAEVVGQDHVVKILEGAIKQGNIAHAYLFCGSRGTGKTSIARIFAREIGCSVNDLYEIDAASNRGIDDVREIRESVNTLPFESKYKVYIVDEVHMLTKEAFNALLKTLEEPPAHVVFILATTELEKLPETVVSRCQTFNFKKPSQQILKDVVTSIAKQEGFTLESGVADLVALLGDGSFRDTQGILQKVIGSAMGKKVTLAEVEAVTGAPQSGLVNDFVIAVLEKNIDKGLGAVHQAAAGNVDMKTYLKLILQKMRFLMLLRFSAGMEKEIQHEVSEADFTWLKTLALRKDIMLSSTVLLELLSAYETVGQAYIPELPLELALMKIIGQDK